MDGEQTQGASPTTPDNTAGASWYASADGDGGAPGGTPGGAPKPPGGGAGGPEPQGAMPGEKALQIEQEQPQTVPVPVTSMKRGGLLGVMDSIADVLAGKTKPELGKDPDGNLYVKQQTLTRGQQWIKIAAEAAHGAAAGLAAGRGAGNMGKAAVAGWNAGTQDQDRAQADEKDMNDQVRQQQLDNANNQMLRMKMAEESWKASRQQVEATQHDVEFSQGQEDRLVKAGATLLGTTAHAGDIAHLQKANPDLMKDLVKNHSLEFVPHYDADGKAAGFKVYKTQNGYRSTVLPPGAEFPTFNAVTQQYDWHKTSDPTTQGEIDDYWTAAGAQGLKAKNDKIENDLKTQQTATSKAEAGKATAEAGKVPSEIKKNNAEAEKARADAAKAETDAGQGAEGEALVDQIGTGKMPMGRLAYLAARKPELLAAVAKKYPGFDGGKIDGYVKTVQDFTSGKTSVQLNAGATALRHMQELKAMNTKWSHVPGTADWNAYHNKVDTLATELARFYGDSTIPAIEKITSTLASNLPKTRDAAIRTQGQSMSDKFDEFENTWHNAAPSEAYEAPMPHMSAAAIAAREELDPKFKTRQVEKLQQQAATTPPGAVQLQPGEVPHVNPQTGQKIVVRNGAWVDVQTGLPVTQ